MKSEKCIIQEIILIIIIQFKIDIYNCINCQNGVLLENSECFNNILVINNLAYRAGHFAKKKNGDIIIEYSTTEKRLFYGLYQNGSNYFENENNFKEKSITGIMYKDFLYQGRYESINLFVSTISDINKEKEYLFSLSSYKTLMEIYDIENDIIHINITEEVFQNGIFSYQFSLFESKINNIYISIYTHSEDGNNYEQGDYFSIKKFNIYENDNNIIVQLLQSSEKTRIARSCRIISGFIGDNGFIYSIFLNTGSRTNEYNLDLKKYDYENLICQESITLVNNIFNNYNGDIYNGAIFKSIYLKNNLACLIYFISESSFNFIILDLASNYNNIITKTIYNNIFPGHQSLNDLIKLNDERLVFFTANNYKIYFIFIDLYNNYSIIKFRYYTYESSIYIFNNELSGYNYNNYFIFSITAIKREIGGNNYNSLLMIFGYANGTDSEINISPYLSDSDSYNINLNLVGTILENLTIDNNIFNYEIINKIKLITIPDNINIYNNSFSQKLQNGDILGLNYIIVQNNQSIKDFRYYNLEYQYIIKEPDYSMFYSTEISSISDNAFNYYTPQIFYGRINTLKFKLCHKFCNTCEIYGTSDDNQKCLSCLPEYQYDYYNLSKTNCVPEGYYYDIDNSHLIQCDDENFDYKNDNNKIFCFPKKSRKCTYYDFLKGLCQYLNYSNYFILNELIPDLIETYPNSNGSNLIIKGQDNINFQITNEKNENEIIENIQINIHEMSVLDLKGCDDILRSIYNINPNDSLIILKLEKEASCVQEKNIQYEIYHPVTKKKLDLSSCNNVELNIPIIFSKDKENLYLNLQKYSYDLLNIEDSFYEDICTKYKSENGTDVLLIDRKNYFYDNDLSCQNNCKYSSYSNNIKFLKCKCEIDHKNITLQKYKDFIYYSFTSEFKSNNYKFLKCHKLVLHINSFTKNYGSIILILLFFIQFIILIIYIIKGIKSLKIDIISLTNKSINNNKYTKNINFKLSKKEENKRNSKKNHKNNPPKKEKKSRGITFMQLFFQNKEQNNKNTDNINNNKNKNLTNKNKLSVKKINKRNDKGRLTQIAIEKKQKIN